MVSNDVTTLDRYASCNYITLLDCNHNWQIWVSSISQWKTDTNITGRSCIPIPTYNSTVMHMPSNFPSLIPSTGEPTDPVIQSTESSDSVTNDLTTTGYNQTVTKSTSSVH